MALQNSQHSQKRKRENMYEPVAWSSSVAGLQCGSRRSAEQETRTGDGDGVRCQSKYMYIEHIYANNLMRSIEIEVTSGWRAAENAFFSQLAAESLRAAMTMTAIRH
ncbi:hypothetical protein L596_000855 [Steinernema carpocapsae]|uniref:Uncharacterized protein n=1 Tax=Steinernema carpocapsae TaxID=34508 RepID=A0A4U8UNJ6_STECR|nr:hypothetical protein L596_000855 [Steinernema carpocapsae]